MLDLEVITLLEFLFQWILAPLSCTPSDNWRSSPANPRTTVARSCNAFCVSNSELSCRAEQGLAAKEDERLIGDAGECNAQLLMYHRVLAD